MLVGSKIVWFWMSWDMQDLINLPSGYHELENHLEVTKKLLQAFTSEMEGGLAANQLISCFVLNLSQRHL